MDRPNMTGQALLFALPALHLCHFVFSFISSSQNVAVFRLPPSQLCVQFLTADWQLHAPTRIECAVILSHDPESQSRLCLFN